MEKIKIQNIFKEVVFSINKPGLWSSGYDNALTRRRSPVRIRPGPLFFMRWWFNGRIGPCQGSDAGSIPAQRTLYYSRSMCRDNQVQKHIAT